MKSGFSCRATVHVVIMKNTIIRFCLQTLSSLQKIALQQLHKNKQLLIECLPSSVSFLQGLFLLNQRKWFQNQVVFLKWARVNSDCEQNFFPFLLETYFWSAISSISSMGNEWTAGRGLPKVCMNWPNHPGYTHDFLIFFPRRKPQNKLWTRKTT